MGVRARDMEGILMLLLLLLLGFVRGDDGGDGGARGHVGVNKVGAGTRAAH